MLCTFYTKVISLFADSLFCMEVSTESSKSTVYYLKGKLEYSELYAEKTLPMPSHAKFHVPGSLPRPVRSLGTEDPPAFSY